MTIYVDVVLIENLLMNYIILFATGVILKVNIKHMRLVLASLIGAIYTIIAYMSAFKIYSNIGLKFVLSAIMIYIAFNPKSVKKLFKFTLIFYLTSFVFGGVAFALIYIVKPQDILRNNGLILNSDSLKVIFISAIIAFVIIIIGFKVVKNKISAKDMYCHINIKLNHKEIETKKINEEIKNPSPIHLL